MHKLLLLYSCLYLSTQLQAQDTIAWKHRAPFWFTPTKNTQIYGLGLGLVNDSQGKTHAKIHGLALELGIGFFLPIGVGTAFSDASTKEAAKRDTAAPGLIINGISLSITGSVRDDKIRGLSLNGIGGASARMHGAQFALIMCMDWELRGLSACLIGNDAYHVRGAQVALLGNSSADHKGFQISIRNYSEKLRGVQIGLFNKSEKLRGLQIGLWNVGEKRSLPLINWES